MKLPQASDNALDQKTEELLRAANQDYQQGLREPQAWLALSERGGRRIRWWLHAPLAALTSAGLVWGLSLYQAPRVQEVAAGAGLRAEPIASLGSPQPVKPSARELPPRAAPIPAEPGLVPNQALTQPAPLVRRPTVPTEAGCRAWLSKHKYAEAAACFERLARSDGVEADVALLEQAQIAINHLADPGRGLDVLDRHQKRLAEGPLRGEAAELRVFAHFALNADERALAESEAVLAAPWGRDAAPNMRWLRGRIYEERLRDCARAAQEYVALLGRAGQRADDAELRRARCFEKLGRREQARAAYSRYLKRVSPLHPDQAEESLRRLAETPADL